MGCFKDFFKGQIWVPLLEVERKTLDISETIKDTEKHDTPLES